MRTFAFRLRDKQDLRGEIDKFAIRNKIKAGVIVTCVGNLKKATLRMANAKATKVFQGSFEIVSLVGTLEAGNSHLHIAISDEKGNIFGGHLKMGSIVGVTVEVVIGELDNLQFKREFDHQTGYKELIVDKTPKEPSD